MISPGSFDGRYLLAGGRTADTVDAEVGRRRPFHRLLLGAHDSFQRRVARFIDAGGDAEHDRELGLDHLDAGLCLALHLERVTFERHRLGEGDRGDV